MKRRGGIIGERVVVNSFAAAIHKITKPIIRVESVCGVDPIAHNVSSNVAFIQDRICTHSLFR